MATIDEVMARAEAVAPVATGPTPPAEAHAAFDLAAAIEGVGGDEEIFREILALFLDDCPRLLDEIRAALAADDARALDRAAHTLKGTAGHFAATAVVEAAQRLEAAGRAGSCRGYGPDLDSLVAALDRFHESLGDLAPPVAPWRAVGDRGLVPEALASF